jgi:hypothetical protein
MKEYNGYNAEYKKLAREEFKKRGVKGRPYTERKQSSQEDNNEFGFPKFKTGFGHW